jgi:hypothetical protein
MIIRHWRSTVAAAVLVLSGFPAAAQSPKSFKARLSPVPVDLTMTQTVAGVGSVTAVLSGSKLTISGTFEGLKSAATIAQVHKGPVAGVRGPVVFDLTVSKGTAGTISGSADLTPLQITDLEKRRLYVQLHSEKAPDGNLWGWLVSQESKR